MAARKDDSRKQTGSDRRAVIWRLPGSHGGDSTAATGPTRPPGRRVPPAAVWGLAAALVLLGLYAAWSEFGDVIRGTGDEPNAAALPVETAPAAGRAGDGAAGGGAGVLASDVDGGGPTSAVVDEAPPAGGDAEAAALADVETGSESDPAAEVAAAAVAREGVEPAAPEDAVSPPASPVEDSPSPSPAVADAAPETTFSPDSGEGGEPMPSAAETVAANAVAAEGGGAVAPVAADALAPGALAARLSALEAHAAGATGSGAAVTALAQRVSALENDAARLELDHALATWGDQQAALEAALAEMSARLAQVEAGAAQQAADDGRLMTLVLATGELGSALGSSAGFASPLETLREIAGDDPEIAATLARLEPFAASGVVTLDGLRARYPVAANAIVRAAPAADDAGWIDETVTRLSQLVTIRRTGGAVDPESIDGRLVEAEAALAAGDLARAIALVEPLASGAAEASSAQAWLGDARARREADAALAELSDTVRARIGARWAATGVSQ